MVSATPQCTHPKKPTKVRVVFDGSCSFLGKSLNGALLSGPDLNDSLIGVLRRFRERPIAVACDIEKMFYRFAVDSDHRDFLRFLWYDENHQVCEYRMTKHIFGASSSPSCAKYGLLQIARDHGTENALARWFIRNCFYVDDGLYSVDTSSQAVELLKQTSDICQTAGLKLHKIMSNQSDVLNVFTPADIACDVKQFEAGDLGSERALGIDWCPVTDVFSFTVARNSFSHPVTRRKMLSLSRILGRRSSWIHISGVATCKTHIAIYMSRIRLG